MLEEKVMELIEKNLKELEAENKQLKKEIAIFQERNDYLEKRNLHLERVLEEIENIACNYEYDEDDEDEEEYEDGDDKAYMDAYTNPLGISMRDMFKIGEAAKDMMSPAEQAMFDMMKKSLGITDEDLK
ncbi:MAG: hypothetical protein ACLSVX_01650 [Massilimicrobiota timonensis]